MKELTEEQKTLAVDMVKTLEAEVVASEKAEKEGVETKPVEAKPNPLVDGIVEWGKTLDFENIPANSVLAIKVNVEDPQYAHHFQMGVVRHVLEPRFSLLKDKKVTVLFMSHKDDLSILTEADMKKSGWIKQEPSRIITLS